ncbi:hypothetical protein AVW11_19805 [Streptomyces amritsarensis]|uniref:Uncharacterized protein n=1 Tax=Streptomyces amritsarensis TaxID=681158 RepID=A0ABX3G4E4_9ACTN|nr:hypothetical protein AVW11_19805 [Streptomyces amritsarensis]
MRTSVAAGTMIRLPSRVPAASWSRSRSQRDMSRAVELPPPVGAWSGRPLRRENRSAVVTWSVTQGSLKAEPGRVT